MKLKLTPHAMPTLQLHVENRPAWEMHHHLPMLWPWFFKVETITESRRFFSTLLDAAELFGGNVAATQANPYLARTLGIFEEVRTENFFRQLGEPPDAILSLDVAMLERERHYSVENAAREWKGFFAAIAEGNEKQAFGHLERATLSPLLLTGNHARDTLALRSATDVLGLGDQDRAAALVQLLMGRPVSRAAKALNVLWVERAARLPIAEFKERRGIVGRLFGKPR
ncbi:hypothetical protein IT570_04910 [Candidatus Sumerlaeota bacterium]|nr:hypothetical protein [Candidatus Sumerlaeota bacterium]